MISLYKDPEGTKIFEKSMSSGLKVTLETKEVLAIGAELSPAVEKHGTPGSVVNFQDSVSCLASLCSQHSFSFSEKMAE